MTDYDKARQTMLEKYGGEAGLRKHYQDMQKKSMQNPNKQKGNMKGGFKGNSELAKKMGDIGRAKQREIREKNSKMAQVDE